MVNPVPKADTTPPAEPVGSGVQGEVVERWMVERRYRDDPQGHWYHDASPLWHSEATARNYVRVEEGERPGVFEFRVTRLRTAPAETHDWTGIHSDVIPCALDGEMPDGGSAAPWTNDTRIVFDGGTGPCDCRPRRDAGAGAGRAVAGAH